MVSKLLLFTLEIPIYAGMYLRFYIVVSTDAVGQNDCVPGKSVASQNLPQKVCG